MRLLFLGVFVLINACNTETHTLNTCNLRTISCLEKHLLVKIIAVDSGTNRYSSNKNKCLFYTAENLNKKDTINLIDVRPELESGTVALYTNRGYQLVFIPEMHDTCFRCFYDKEVFYEKKNKFPFVVGKLRALVQ
jgi:hypothetical protein